MSAGLEIERKFLIRMPNADRLAAMPGCVIWDIEQRYLARAEDGSSRRIRRICVGGRMQYFFTQKRRINALSCEEREEEISADAYAALMDQTDPALKPICKRRYRIPYLGQLLEVDIYSFWQDRGTLEIEMEREDQQLQLPEWLRILRDVTGEFAYKNLSLAAHVPMEALEEA